MKISKKIGFDLWRIKLDINDFLRIVQSYNLEIYDVTFMHQVVSFHASIWQRMHIHQVLKDAQYIKTTGVLGYFMRTLKRPTRMIGISTAFIVFYLLSNMTFQIEIKGENKASKQLIAKTLQKAGIQTPCFIPNEESLKMKLKKTLENNIAWLEIVKSGSKLLITYTPKEFAKDLKLTRNQLIAQKDAMITRYDIQHGFKTKPIHTIVHKGEVLVDNVLDDSKGVKEEIYVKGRVYGYTWYDITVSIDQDNTIKAIQYFELLMNARREVSKDFLPDDKIYKEKILQFTQEAGKIKMVVHYTILQDITTP